MVRLMLAPALLAPLALAACAADSAGGDTAAAATPPGQDCFTLDQVTAYHRANYDTLYLQANDKTYRVELAGSCGDMRWTEAVENSRGTGLVCAGGNSPRTGYNATRCQLSEVRTEDQPIPQMTPMPVR